MMMMMMMMMMMIHPNLLQGLRKTQLFAGGKVPPLEPESSEFVPGRVFIPSKGAPAGPTGR